MGKVPRLPGRPKRTTPASVSTQQRAGKQIDELSNLIDHWPQAVAIVDSQGRILRANGLFLESYSSNTSSLLELFADGEGKRFAIAMQVSLMSGGYRGVFKSNGPLDGGRFVEVALYRQGEKNGDPRVLAVFELAGESYARTLESEATRDRLELAARLSRDGIFDWNLETSQVDYSPRVAQMMGVEEESLRPVIREYLRRVHPDDCGLVESMLAQSQSRPGEVTEWEHRLRSSRTRYRWVLTRSISVEDARGRVYRMVGLLTDVTDTRDAEWRDRVHLSQLAHVLRIRTVSHMAASLAHELNQPLSVITNYALGAQRRLRSKLPEQREVLGKIAEQAQRAGAIVHRLREFVRNRSPQRDVVDLNGMVRRVAELLSPMSRLRGIEWQLDLNDSITPVMGDRVLLEQVLVNLIVNAFEAIETGGKKRGRVTVTTRPWEAGRALLEVHDTGPGLARSVRKRLFEPFTSSKSEGLGIGLSLCQSIVTSHGGEIGIVGNRQRGTRVRVILPVSLRRDKEKAD